jgi:hypothetical protein
MGAIFLSASVPVVGRGKFHESANPFLIQCAVREFVTVTLGRRLIIWGGHPAITPMVWAVCEDIGVKFSKAVTLYQSKYFVDDFPDENKHFGNVEYVDAVPNNREASLLRMREKMLSRGDLDVAVFIGGMEGVLEEYALFKQLHPTAQVLSVPGPGGAARELAETTGVAKGVDLRTLDFAELFHKALNIAPNDPRTS